ncbi:MAG: hypothetical protein Q8P18_30355 [Pseudomonadota bacterium]|nr:hypothetical protein [Pseudomonadota bacterium]
MSMLLLLSVGCSNLPVSDWKGGGARYASGYASEEDTAATDTGEPTTSTEGAPELVGESCIYSDGEVVGQLYILCGIAVNDSNDDLVGGYVYLSLFGDGVALGEEARLIVSADADGNTEALYANENVTFTVGPVVEGVVHEVELYMVDFTHNSSNEITVPVTGS